MAIDHISNLIISIKNAGAAGRESLAVPFSNMKEAVLVLLQKEGYIKSYEVKGKPAKTLHIELLTVAGEPRIQGVKRVSHLSMRMYTKVRDVRPVKHGHGMLVLTTPKGILSDKMAKKENVGGEPLFKIW